jgi:hypothetical protein
MTEAEWLECDDPQKMLYFLEAKPTRQRRKSDGRASGTVRKGLAARVTSNRVRLLFTCACCRRLWAMIPIEESARWVELAEACADGASDLAQVVELLHASFETSSPGKRLAKGSYSYEEQKDTDLGATLGTFHSLLRNLCNLEDSWFWDKRAVLETLRTAGRHAWQAARRKPKERRLALSNAAVDAEQDVLAQLLRDLFGNPFRQASIGSGSLPLTVRLLAQAAYDERQLPEATLDPARLAVLADALEEAGCQDQSILDHCRGPGPHVRGCWLRFVDCQYPDKMAG